MMKRMVYWSAVNQFVHISNNLIGVKKSVMSFVVGNNDEDAATIHGAIKYSSACGHTAFTRARAIAKNVRHTVQTIGVCS